MEVTITLTDEQAMVLRMVAEARRATIEDVAVMAIASGIERFKAKVRIAMEQRGYVERWPGEFFDAALADRLRTRAETRL